MAEEQKGGVSALFSSRKFWVGTLSVVCTIGAVTLRAMGLIPADALVPTIIALTTTSVGFMVSTAWEDSAQKKADAAVLAPPNAPQQTVNVNPTPANPSTPPVS